MRNNRAGYFGEARECDPATRCRDEGMANLFAHLHSTAGLG